MIFINSKLNAHPEALYEQKFNVESTCIDDFLLHYLLGSQLIKLEKYQEAEIHLIEAAKIYPCDVALNELANVFIHLNKTDLAEECFLQSVKMRPNAKEKVE
jgi:tetratricopeptide (TPR) repeat protein